MARAKRTDRAEARRRYRQTTAATLADEDAATVAADAASGSAGPRTSTAPRTTPGGAKSGRAADGSTPPTRMSIMESVRWAARGANIRDDLRATPWLVTRTKAVWVPALLTVASAAAFLVFGPQQNAIALLAFQAFVVPPPMAGSFLAGLLTPRAAWLAGGINGAIAGVIYAVVAFIYPDAGGSTGATSARASAALFALLMSPTVGLAVGAFAGFYRRFLRAANPNPQRQTRSGRRASSTRSTARR